jgi:hypothetical protein
MSCRGCGARDHNVASCLTLEAAAWHERQAAKIRAHLAELAEQRRRAVVPAGIRALARKLGGMP